MNSKPMLVNLKKKIQLPANNDNLDIFSSLEINKGRSAVKIYSSGNVSNSFSICADNNCIRRDYDHSLFLLEAKYRVWISEEDSSIDLYSYNNYNNNIFYSFYSFFGEIDLTKSTINDNIIFQYKSKSKKGNCFSFALIDPVFKEDFRSIKIDKPNQSCYYYITKETGKIIKEV